MRLGWAAKCATLNGNEQMNCLVIVPTELFIDLNGLFASKVIAIHSSGFIICFRLSLPVLVTVHLTLHCQRQTRRIRNLLTSCEYTMCPLPLLPYDTAIAPEDKLDSKDI